MGLMIRFSAGSEEVGALLRFLRRRAPQGRLLVASLADAERRSERTFRRTERPLVRRLSAQKAGGAWAMLTAQDKTDAGRAAPPLLILHLGVADSFGRREGMLEARDEITGDPPDYTPRCHVARNLAERCARRVRHRGTPEKGRWSLPF